jgi:hypothetical protein
VDSLLFAAEQTGVHAMYNRYRRWLLLLMHNPMNLCYVQTLCIKSGEALQATARRWKAEGPLRRSR